MERPTFLPFGKKIGEYYKLTDEFCLFYLKWVDGKTYQQQTAGYWTSQARTPGYLAWLGLAFEALCHKHEKQLAKACQLPTGANIASWRYQPKDKQKKGAQIDLLFDRTDDTITLCEIKCTQRPFVVTKAEYQALQDKRQIFINTTKTTKQVFIVLVSMNGVKANAYSDLLTQVITGDALFEA